MSAPASTAAMYAIGAIPLEQCECTAIGPRVNTCLTAAISSQVVWGLSSPEVSLMTRESQPSFCRPLASEHQSSRL